MTANGITLARLPLLLLSVLLLHFGSATARFVGVGLLFAGLMLDTLDGVVARRLGETSLIGSVLDIAADRTYELVLWVYFAHLGMLPLAIPLVVIARTTLTDALRGLGVSEGTAPFDQAGGTLGRFLVGSAGMRTAYSVSKVVTFCGLALLHATAGRSPDGSVQPAGGWLPALFHVTAWLAVILCILRGLPVIAGSRRVVDPLCRR